MDYSGLSAPIDKRNGGYFYPSNLEELLWSSLLLILTTDKGSMPGKRNFGTNISRFIFEQMSSFSVGELQVQIKSVIEENDNRILVQSVSVIRQRDTIYIKLRILNKISRSVYERTFQLLQ